MNIRHGTTDDAKLLAEFGAQAFYDSFARDNTEENIRLYLNNKYSPEMQLEELSDPDVVFLIAEAKDRMVGYAKVNLNSTNDAVRGVKTMEIERIYAAKDLIGQGIGKELMLACLQEARQRNCNSVWLGVWEKNPRAIEFYRKWGFKEVGTQTFMVGNDPQRDFIMELELS
jgi:ribosomal protein S18 acetylase RimI-like enzyme